MKKAVLILGATSSMARAAAASFAKKGHPLYLAGRDTDDLERTATDLRIRYEIEVHTGAFDAEATDSHAEFLQHAVRESDGLDGVLLGFGYLGAQEEAIRNFDEAKRIIDCNFTGACSILTHCADYFEQQGHGFIAAIGSVAGDRGRQSNYVYGAAKGGLALFLQGLRNRLFHSDVSVTTIKPGFVDTAMTFGLPGLFLVATPEYVGDHIVRAVDAGRNTVYIPWFWTGIMGIIKSIPEFIFKKMKL